MGLKTMKFELRTWLISILMMAALAGCSVFGVRDTEEAVYQVTLAEGEFELRQYDPMIVATTFVDGDFDNAGDVAFRRLFGYITGDNSGALKISMTAPVTGLRGADSAGADIAMTAPVSGQAIGPGWAFSFVLPEGYTLDNSPRPSDAEIELKRIPAQRMAVVRYSGLRSKSSFEENTERLRAWLAEQSLQAVSEPMYAGYDPPWTLPFLRRNEVLLGLLP